MSLEHDRKQEVAVSVLIEEHGELVAVVALNGAFAPAIAYDASADHEWLGSGRRRGMRCVVVWDPLESTCRHASLSIL